MKSRQTNVRALAAAIRRLIPNEPTRSLSASSNVMGEKCLQRYFFIFRFSDGREHGEDEGTVHGSRDATRAVSGLKAIWPRRRRLLRRATREQQTERGLRVVEHPRSWRALRPPTTPREQAFHVAVARASNGTVRRVDARLRARNGA